MRTVVFYRNASGDSPVEEYLDGLNDRQAKKVTWVMNLVKELDRVPTTYLKKLEGTEHIWEIRASLGGDAFRLLGFFYQGALIVLTNGFSKKQQKTPQTEIELAVSRRRDYLARSTSHGRS